MPDQSKTRSAPEKSGASPNHRSGSGLARKWAKIDTVRPTDRFFGRTFVFYASLVLITAGLVVLAVIGYRSFFTDLSENGSLYHGLIRPQRIVELPIGGLSRPEALRLLQDKQKELSSARQDIVVLRLTREAVSGRPLSSKKFMELIAPRSPKALIRLVAEQRVYGVLTDGPSPFIILRLAEAESGFAAVRRWEEGLAADMAGVLHSRPAGSVRISSIRLGQREARLFKNSAGREVAAYMFLEPAVVAVAPEAATLKRVWDIYRSAQTES